MGPFIYYVTHAVYSICGACLRDGFIINALVPRYFLASAECAPVLDGGEYGSLLKLQTAQHPCMRRCFSKLSRSVLPTGTCYKNGGGLSAFLVIRTRVREPTGILKGFFSSRLGVFPSPARVQYLALASSKHPLKRRRTYTACFLTVASTASMQPKTSTLCICIYGLNAEGSGFSEP